eukprot:7497237-Alexandrium_andersonii.AAC.1
MAAQHVDIGKSHQDVPLLLGVAMSNLSTSLRAEFAMGGHARNTYTTTVAPLHRQWWLERHHSWKHVGGQSLHAAEEWLKS